MYIYMYIYIYIHTGSSAHDGRGLVLSTLGERQDTQKKRREAVAREGRDSGEREKRQCEMGRC